jgi:hypothetical protein
MRRILQETAPVVGTRILDGHLFVKTAGAAMACTAVSGNRNGALPIETAG